MGENSQVARGVMTEPGLQAGSSVWPADIWTLREPRRLVEIAAVEQDYLQVVT
jgi:hypothetical protein